MDLGILIPILALTIPIVAIWIKHQQSVEKMRLEAGRHEEGPRAAQQAQRMAELEDRVRVLERIVTDPGTNLADQIEALRDHRQPISSDAGVPLARESRTERA